MDGRDRPNGGLGKSRGDIEGRLGAVGSLRDAVASDGSAAKFAFLTFGLSNSYMRRQGVEVRTGARGYAAAIQLHSKGARHGRGSYYTGKGSVGSVFWDAVYGLRVAVLDGTYCISRTGQPFTPMFAQNRPSLDDEAMNSLWLMVAKMISKGQLEVITRWDPIPRHIVGCGAVPKFSPPFRRLITDYRPTNPYVDPWPVKYITMQRVALVLRVNSLMCTRDMCQAYYNGVLGACRRVAEDVLCWM